MAMTDKSRQSGSFRDLRDFLSNIGMVDKAFNVLLDNDVDDLETLVELTKQDLMDMGLKAGPAAKIYSAGQRSRSVSSDTAFSRKLAVVPPTRTRHAAPVPGTPESVSLEALVEIIGNSIEDPGSQIDMALGKAFELLVKLLLVPASRPSSFADLLPQETTVTLTALVGALPIQLSLSASAASIDAVVEAVFDKITFDKARSIVASLAKFAPRGSPMEVLARLLADAAKELASLLPPFLRQGLSFSGEMSLSGSPATGIAAASSGWTIHIGEFDVKVETIKKLITGGSLKVESPLITVDSVGSFLNKLDDGLSSFEEVHKTLEPFLNTLEKAAGAADGILGAFADNIGIVIGGTISKKTGLTVKTVMLEVRDDSGNEIVSQDLIALSKTKQLQLVMHNVQPMELADRIIPTNAGNLARVGFEALKQVPFVQELEFEEATLLLGKKPKISAKPAISQDDMVGYMLHQFGIADMVSFTTDPKPQLGISTTFQLTVIEGNGSPFFDSQATLSLAVTGTELYLGGQVGVSMTMLKEKVSFDLSLGIKAGRKGGGFNMTGAMSAFRPKAKEFSWFEVGRLNFDIELKVGPIVVTKVCAKGALTLFGQDAQAMVVFDPTGAGMGFKVDVITDLRTMLKAWGSSLPSGFDLSVEGHVRMAVPGLDLNSAGVEYEGSVIPYGISHMMNANLFGMKVAIAGTTSPIPEVGYSVDFMIDGTEFNKMTEKLLEKLDDECSKFVEELKQNKQELEEALNEAIADVHRTLEHEKANAHAKFDVAERALESANVAYEKEKTNARNKFDNESRRAKNVISNARKDVASADRAFNKEKENANRKFRNAQAKVNTLNRNIAHANAKPNFWAGFIPNVEKAAELAALEIALATATAALSVAKAVYTQGILTCSQAVAVNVANAALTAALAMYNPILDAMEAAYTEGLLNCTQQVALTVAHAALQAAEAVYTAALTVADKVAAAALIAVRETAKLALDVAAAAIKIGVAFLQKLASLFQLNHLAGGIEISTKQQMFYFQVDIVIFGVPVKFDLTVVLGDILEMLAEIVLDIVHAIMGDIEKQVDEGKTDPVNHPPPNPVPEGGGKYAGAKFKLKSWHGDYLHGPYVDPLSLVDKPFGTKQTSDDMAFIWTIEEVGDGKVMLTLPNGAHLHRKDSKDAHSIVTYAGGGSTTKGNLWTIEELDSGMGQGKFQSSEQLLSFRSWKGDYLHCTNGNSVGGWDSNGIPEYDVINYTAGVGNVWTLWYVA